MKKLIEIFDRQRWDYKKTEKKNEKNISTYSVVIFSGK